MLPVWVSLILVALVVDPCSKGVKISLCHDTLLLKMVEPFVDQIFRMLLKVIFENGKPGFTHLVVPKVSVVLGTIEVESGYCT